MFKDALIDKLDERRRWACNDCRTYLFAKSQTGWRDHEAWLGGGNMAKPLILFAFWDVMAGIYAHHLSSESGLIWSTASADAVAKYAESIKAEIDAGKKGKTAIGMLHLVVPKVGDMIHAGKVLQVFLEAHVRFTNLGVEPKYFAHTLRPEYRNPLAHMYSPRLNGGVYSTVPRPAFFDEMMHWIANSPESVVRDDVGTKRINGPAMLRDSERLAHALLAEVRESFSEEEARTALNWLGLIEEAIVESSALNSDQ